MTRPRVIVIGAGIAGLSAAHRLATTTDAEVVVCESSQQLGGVAQTERHDDRLREWGPEAVPGSPPVLADLAALGLSTEPAAPTGGTLLWLRGRLRPLPVQLANGAIPRPGDALALVRDGVLPPTTLLRMACEPVMAIGPREPGTLADTYGRRLGRGAVRRLIAPFAEGVFGAPADVLADDVVPRPTGGSLVMASVKRWRRRPEPAASRGGLVAIVGGMTRLVEALAAPLDVRLGEPVLGVERLSDGGYGVRCGGEVVVADGVIVATPPPEAGRLLREVADHAADALSQAATSSSVVIHVDAVPEDCARLSALGASGWLGAPEEQPVVAAGSFVGLKWPHLARPGAIRAVVRRPDLLLEHDQRLLAAALDEIEQVLQVRLTRSAAELRRWMNALPLRTPDAVVRAARARNALPHGLDLVGTAELRSGVTSVMASGRDGADRLAATFTTGQLTGRAG